jgi:methyltransferase-like protein/2-polyprenyl-3-methyl-5-hydroxy-6-metoxy-1,4-benzoquinol methylase
MTTYDDTPYPSHSYSASGPAHTSAIGMLFGMTPAGLETARVLEIGCASGGNIIPFAARFPNSICLGIDLSEKQIADADKSVKDLKLQNISFKAISILDLDLKDQKFDFIIVHGVYSWVPDDVQKQILRICGENLDANGIAYISYNTLPGWNAVKTVRDMMLYHGQNFDNPNDKVREARNMLQFAHDNISEETGPYKLSLDNEIKVLSTVDDNYLLHDHLEAHNEPSYFHEFMAEADKYGLGYLGDSSIASMFIGNQKKDAAEKLTEISEIIRQEQYVDFLTNRRFRSTLLVLGSVELTRNVTPVSVSELSLISLYGLKDSIPESEFSNTSELDLVSFANPEATVNVKGEYLCGMILELLSASPRALKRSELIQSIRERFTDVTKTDLETIWDSNILNLIFRGILRLENSPVQPSVKVGEVPCVFSVSRHQALSQTIVPNLRFDSIKLTDGQRVVIQYVNGENTLEAIFENVLAHVKKRELTINQNGSAVDPKSSSLEDIVREYVREELKRFSSQSFLVS